MTKKYSVVVGGPAVGKSFLAKHDNRFIDLDEIKAKYKYGILDDNKDFEKNKSNRGKVVHNDSLEYVLDILNKTIQTEKIVLISFNKQILEYVINNKINYCLVYPNLNSREEYVERMKNRGNNDIFINAMTNEKDWTSFYIKNSQDNLPNFKIELKEGQYLSDVKEYFYS